MNTNSLSPEERHVIEDKGTEAPFSGEYNDFYKDGTYICRKCDNPLFPSSAKFKSGCGWPSFDDHFRGSVERVLTTGDHRTEIVCAKCGAHLGHVFKGEKMTKKNTRHCVNSLSIKFIENDEKQ